MHLQRVQVPNFRALKSIDITFEKERIPRIFPLASLNGGGKSTFLQLIFTLLTCSANPDKHEFLVNILKDFEIEYESDNTLATIELVDNDKTIAIEFYCSATSHLVNNFLSEDDKKTLIKFGFNQYSPYYFSDIYTEIEALSRDVLSKSASKQSVDEKIEFKRAKISRNEMEGYTVSNQEPSIESRKVSRELELESEKLSEEINLLEEKVVEISSQIEITEQVLASKQVYCYELQFADNSRKAIIDNLKSEGIQYICSFKADEVTEVNLLCRISGNSEKIDVLKKTSYNVFLAAPESQVFLFFIREDIDILFGNKSNENELLTIKKNQNRLTNFFLYNLSIIKILAESFAKAKDNDWQQAIETRGQYGTEYAKISRDLEYVFSGKIIEPLKDLSGIIIKTVENGKERILHPEDLSHGELRRLSFYAWLRTKEIQDAIVLVDEIEIGLHPDWQYQIVKDLEEWAPSNQYILATHSYEICSALTPAHVKEIEPKLVKPEAASTH
jgi:predicted ATPase